MKKILRSTWLRYLLPCILAVAAGVNAFALNAAGLAGNAVPMPFGVGASVVLSGSMEPALSVGDLLIIRQQPAYETGDIVVFQCGSMPVVHRIVDISGDLVTTRGDANNVDDEPIPVGAVKGAVVAVVPVLGHMILALKGPAAMAAMLLAAVLLLEWSFHTGKTEKETEKEKLKEEIRILMDRLKEE